MSKATAVWTESIALNKNGFEFANTQYTAPSTQASLPNHAIYSDKLAISPMSARPKRTGRTVRCMSGKETRWK